MPAEEDPNEKWAVYFSEIQKCSAVGSASLYKEDQWKKTLNTKTLALLLDAD